MIRTSDETRTGLLQGLGAYSIWGLLPLYFHLLSMVGAAEMLAQRILWSIVLILLIMVVRRETSSLLATLRQPRLVGALATSAVLIAANWLTYIWAVEHHQVLAASLGYFLNPLVNVAIGVILLKEKLGRAQWLAIALAGVGVVLLAAHASDALWISLALALSFAFYGYVRKLTPVPPITGLGVETLLLAGPAVATLAWLSTHGGLVFGDSAWIDLLLAASGVITSVPLILFAAAARRLPMVTLGLLQYIAPTLQFALAIVLLGETLPVASWASFGMIWAGLAVFIADALRRQRRA